MFIELSLSHIETKKKRYVEKAKMAQTNDTIKDGFYNSGKNGEIMIL